MQNLNDFLKANIDKLPLCMHYSELLGMAERKFSISKKEARKRYGLLTYKEWNKLLNGKSA